MSIRRGFRALREAGAGLSRADAILLGSLLAVVLCVWAFAAVADRVSAGYSQAIDEHILRSLRVPGNLSEPRGPSWLPNAMRDLTALGSAPVLALLVLAVAGTLAVRRQLHALVVLVVATIGGFLLNELLKELFARPRPAPAFHLTEVRSLSFPSGHAMESAIIYLTLAALAAGLVQARALKLYFVGLAVLLSIVVGSSRVYLGVHYPSDVFAGWTAGLAWALLCWTVARYLKGRGAVETP